MGPSGHGNRQHHMAVSRMNQEQLACWRIGIRFLGRRRLCQAARHQICAVRCGDKAMGILDPLILCGYLIGSGIDGDYFFGRPQRHRSGHDAAMKAAIGTKRFIDYAILDALNEVKCRQTSHGGSA